MRAVLLLGIGFGNDFAAACHLALRLTNDIISPTSLSLSFSLPHFFHNHTQTHPSIGITKRSMGIMNNFVIDMMDKLALEAKHDLGISGKEKTLREWHLNTAVKLVLPGELKKHGVSEGTKAIPNFNANRKK